MVEVIGAIIGLVILSVCFGANFYLLCLWLVYPILRRRRFQVCKPYLLIGWILYVGGGAVIRQIGRDQQAETVTNAGNLVAVIGLGLTVYAAMRLLRANAAERRAARITQTTVSAEGVWPPPPSGEFRGE